MIIDKEISQQVEKIKSQTKGNILVQGSASIVNVLLENTLLDELRLLVHPYIAGKGKKLFEANLDLDLNTSLKLIERKAFNNGVVLLIYSV